MAISTELSSEIANALLTAKDLSPEELKTVKTILMEVHTALQSMDAETRAHRGTVKNPEKSGSAGFELGL